MHICHYYFFLEEVGEATSLPLGAPPVGGGGHLPPQWMGGRGFGRVSNRCGVEPMPGGQRGPHGAGCLFRCVDHQGLRLFSETGGSTAEHIPEELTVYLAFMYVPHLKDLEPFLFLL